MSAGLTGEVRLFACGLLAGWLACDGGTASVAQYPLLAAMLGTVYGGDGVNTFGLPDLRGGSVVGAQSNGVGSYALGQTGGEATVMLEMGQMPAHSHEAVCAASLGNQLSPANGVWAVTSGGEAQYAPTQLVLMAEDALQNTGGVEGHPNMQPYVALIYAVATGA